MSAIPTTRPGAASCRPEGSRADLHFLGRAFTLRITSAALRSVDHRGGLDAFAKAKDADLSADALKIKKDIQKAKASA